MNTFTKLWEYREFERKLSLIIPSGYWDLNNHVVSSKKERKSLPHCNRSKLRCLLYLHITYIQKDSNTCLKLVHTNDMYELATYIPVLPLGLAWTLVNMSASLSFDLKLCDDIYGEYYLSNKVTINLCFWSSCRTLKSMQCEVLPCHHSQVPLTKSLQISTHSCLTHISSHLTTAIARYSAFCLRSRNHIFLSLLFETPNFPSLKLDPA